MNLPKIKYSQTATCPKCGGMLAYDARMTQKLPLGLGFAPGSSRFQVDVAIFNGWRGECMECFAQVFAVASTRHATRYPASINRKLALNHYPGRSLDDRQTAGMEVGS